jgi:SAM-dependent methyltransferase/uncharacterized protein YbaR (Trm112 family)
MKERILDLLVCPACGGKLSMKSFSRGHGEVGEGLLECSCGQWYPIIGFVPRLLLGEYRGDYGEFLDKHSLKHLKGETQASGRSDSSGTQVQRSFGAKWTSQPLWGTRGETKAFMREWILEKYGWEDEKGFRAALGQRGRILDAGAGLGREVVNFCEACEKGEVFGVDVSEVVDPAYLNTRDYPNAHIIQADLMQLPFTRASFDFIFNEGVLHHTPDTRRGFEVLVDFLAPGGEIAFYVYKRKGPIREFCDDYIRGLTTKLSEGECWEFSRTMTRLGKALSDLHVELEIPEDIPPLGIKAGHYDLQRFFYYHIFKCFWNDRFNFEENNLINFDWYHPQYAHRHAPAEVKAWIEQAGLTPRYFHIEGAGIAARAVKS